VKEGGPKSRNVQTTWEVYSGKDRRNDPGVHVREVLRNGMNANQERIQNEETEAQ